MLLKDLFCNLRFCNLWSWFAVSIAHLWRILWSWWRDLECGKGIRIDTVWVVAVVQDRRFATTVSGRIVVNVPLVHRHCPEPNSHLHIPARRFIWVSCWTIHSRLILSLNFFFWFIWHIRDASNPLSKGNTPSAYPEFGHKVGWD